MFLNKLFDSERACREWEKCCVSCGIQIDLLVAHHAQIFKRVCVREALHRQSTGGGRISELELSTLLLTSVC
jgi:hypothetical protein